MRVVLKNTCYHSRKSKPIFNVECHILSKALVEMLLVTKRSACFLQVGFQLDYK